MSRRINLEFNRQAVLLMNEMTETTSQDPMNQTLLNYAVATLGESFFKKQRDEAKKQLLAAVALSPDSQSRIDNAIHDTETTDQGVSQLIVEADDLQLILNTKRGAERLDKTALRNELIKVIDPKIVDAALLRATKQSAPSCTYVVHENGA